MLRCSKLSKCRLPREIHHRGIRRRHRGRHRGELRRRSQASAGTITRSNSVGKAEDPFPAGRRPSKHRGERLAPSQAAAKDQHQAQGTCLPPPQPRKSTRIFEFCLLMCRKRDKCRRFSKTAKNWSSSSMRNWNLRPSAAVRILFRNGNVPFMFI